MAAPSYCHRVCKKGAIITPPVSTFLEKATAALIFIFQNRRMATAYAILAHKINCQNCGFF